jgi:hypothetical protein
VKSGLLFHSAPAEAGGGTMSTLDWIGLFIGAVMMGSIVFLA